MGFRNRAVCRRLFRRLQRAANTATADYWYVAAFAGGVYFGVWAEHTYSNYARPWQYALAIFAGGILTILIGQKIETRQKVWKPKTAWEQLQAKGIEYHDHSDLNHRHPFNDLAHTHYLGTFGVYDYKVHGF